MRGFQSSEIIAVCPFMTHAPNNFMEMTRPLIATFASGIESGRRIYAKSFVSAAVAYENRSAAGIV
jgi:hypothetical protein